MPIFQGNARFDGFGLKRRWRALLCLMNQALNDFESVLTQCISVGQGKRAVPIRIPVRAKHAGRKSR